jgi:hypothetical protein
MNFDGIDVFQLNINLETEEDIKSHIETHEELNQD